MYKEKSPLNVFKSLKIPQKKMILYYYLRFSLWDKGRSK